MKLNNQSALKLSLFLLPVSLAFVSGCQREEIKTYRVAKEQTAPKPSDSTHSELPDGHPTVTRSKPKVSWTLPSSWKEVQPASEMTIAAFEVSDGDNEAQVAITPLRGMAGKEVAIVNMWRQVVGLPQISAEEVEKQLEPVKIGSESGKLYEITNQPDGASRPTRVIAAMVHRSDASWFYKLAGDPEFVEKQKPAFVAFLASIKIEEPSSTQSAPAPTAHVEETAGKSSEWKTPPGWKEVTPGQMQLAKFTVPEKGAAKADVSISVFPSETGGALANINRWRGQIGLSTVSESELARIVTKIDEKLPGAVLVDMTNGNRQLIGAIVPRGGQWYFFKLMGESDAVAPQKSAFVSFVKSPQ